VAQRAQQFTPHKQCICSVIRELTWLETSPLLSGARECQKKEQLAIRFANAQLIQEFPDLLICIKGLISHGSIRRSNLCPSSIRTLRVTNGRFPSVDVHMTDFE
jgi:hypothetical protein